jgi:hypothetical protein
MPMSIRKRRKIKFRVGKKRAKSRARLKAAGKEPNEYFYSGVYVGERKE